MYFTFTMFNTYHFYSISSQKKLNIGNIILIFTAHYILLIYYLILGSALSLIKIRKVIIIQL
jgi:hypothetical protein